MVDITLTLVDETPIVSYMTHLLYTHSITVDDALTIAVNTAIL